MTVEIITSRGACVASMVRTVMASSRSTASSIRAKRSLAQALLRVVGRMVMMTLTVNIRRRLVLVAHLGVLIG